MAKERPPFRVNSWFNPVTDARGEVWYEGWAFILYLNDEKLMTFPIFRLEGWTDTHCELVAAGEACHWGYKKVMGKDWEG